MTENAIVPWAERLKAEAKAVAETEKQSIRSISLQGGIMKLGDVAVLVQPISRQRTNLEAKMSYKINSLKNVEPVSPPSQDITREITRKFLELGRQKADKPSNVSTKIK